MIELSFLQVALYFQEFTGMFYTSDCKVSSHIVHVGIGCSSKIYCAQGAAEWHNIFYLSSLFLHERYDNPYIFNSDSDTVRTKTNQSLLGWQFRKSVTHHSAVLE